MKNVQIIDGAINSSFSIYSIPEAVFNQIFPAPGQNIEFIEDVVRRVGEKQAGELMKSTWGSRKEKQHVNGIHGTLFIQIENRKALYPNKRESDLDDPVFQINPAS
jgi:hypothetical protein